MIKHIRYYDQMEEWLSVNYPDIPLFLAIDSTSIHFKLYEFLEWYLNELEDKGNTIVSVDPLFVRIPNDSLVPTCSAP